MTWSEFVKRVIGNEANEKTGAKVGVSGPTVGRWINGSTGAPRVEVAVAFARAYGVSVLETFVEAGYITPEEAGAVPSLTAAPRALTNDELLELVRTRMTEEVTGNAEHPAAKTERHLAAASGGATREEADEASAAGAAARARQDEARAAMKKRKE